MTHPAGPPTPPTAGGPPPAVCIRHPDRPTGLTCVRCGRPACPECLREASVGYQCVDCVAEGSRTLRRGTTVAGAELRTGRPVVTQTLIALNLVAFVWTVVQAQSLMGNNAAPLFRSWALVPGLVAEGEWWRLVTAGFLHFGPLHIASNMYALWVLGRELEPVLGRARFLGVYAIGLLGGSAAVMLFSGSSSAVAGASTAVFGLMGGLAIVMRRLKVPMGQVVGLIVVNLVITFVLPFISVAGHIGGLLAGTAATAALVYAPARSRNAVQAGVLAGLFVLIVVAIAVAVLLI